MNDDARHMARALELATRGEGFVEPNPMVGCVLVRQGHRIGEGWHRRYGGPHAEIEALRSINGPATGATMYVSLEPCCHTGKTPPCTDAVIEAGLTRVVIAQRDPYPEVGGQGIERLRAAGIQVEVGLLEEAARQLNAPFRKLVERGVPWIIAKWAMTLDGKLASRTGHSRWISSEGSRRRVHELRRRVDAIMVGRGTVVADNPRLTARPPGERVATRIVVDSQASLPHRCALVETAREQPVLIATSRQADPDRCQRLEQAGCETLRCEGDTQQTRLQSLLKELGRRRMTNVLVEGGGRLLGSLFDLDNIDELHVFVAPKLVGGQAGPSPMAGVGLAEISPLPSLDEPRIEVIEHDVYISGRLSRKPSSSSSQNGAQNPR